MTSPTFAETFAKIRPDSGISNPCSRFSRLRHPRTRLPQHLQPNQRKPGSPSQETGDDDINSTVFMQYVQGTYIIRNPANLNSQYYILYRGSRNYLNTHPAISMPGKIERIKQLHKPTQYFTSEKIKRIKQFKKNGFEIYTAKTLLKNDKEKTVSKFCSEKTILKFSWKNDFEKRF